jgi:hypothetical protein
VCDQLVLFVLESPHRVEEVLRPREDIVGLQTILHPREHGLTFQQRHAQSPGNRVGREDEPTRMLHASGQQVTRRMRHGPYDG